MITKEEFDFFISGLALAALVWLLTINARMQKQQQKWDELVNRINKMIDEEERKQ